MIILTDLSEVLIGGVVDAEKYVAEHYGKETAQMCVTRHRAINESFRNMLRGKIAEDQYWAHFMYDFLFDVEIAKEALSWSLQQAIPGTLKVYQEIIAYPHDFRSGAQTIVDGMPDIYLVSDHILERIAEIKNLHPGIFRITKKEIWSCNIGKIKQDAGFFDELLDRENLSPDEVIFVDDNVTNVINATRAGIRSIHFRNAEQLKTTLRDTFGFEFLNKP